MAYDPNCEETKAEIQRQIAEATAGLTKKRDELLNEVKTLKTATREGKDPQELVRLEAKIEKLEGELETNTAALRKAERDLGKVTKERDTEASFSTRHLTESAISAALAEAKIAPQFHDAVKAMISPQTKIITEGDVRKVVVGDKDLVSHVKEWSQSDTGKHYVAAANNNGGGANGGGANGGGKTMTRTAFQAADAATRMAFSKEGGQVIDG